MKKYFFILSATAFSLISCTKETKVTSADNDSTHVVETERLTVDSARLDSTEAKLKKAADTTGKVLKKAAQELKEGAKELTGEAAAAVEKGARNVKDEMKD